MYESTVIAVLEDVLRRSDLKPESELRDLGMDSLDRCSIQQELEDAAATDGATINITDADAASWKTVACVCASYDELMKAARV